MTVRRTLMVAGFLGRGNCGDEAMFQVIYEHFAPQFDIIASVDQHGAYPGFWDWYPYNACRIVHQIDTAVLEHGRGVAGLIVGGGGLGFGFAANQVIAARCFGVPRAFAGTDLPKTAHLQTPVGLRTAADYLALFDYVGIRTGSGVERAQTLGLSVDHAADWALGLPHDGAEEEQAAGDIAIVLREYPAAMVPAAYVGTVRGLLDGLTARGWRPFLLPFSPEDERFLAEHGVAELAPVRRCWWNARRMKQVIADAAGLISVGRLHPLIFAASTRTRVAALCGTAGGAKRGHAADAENCGYVCGTGDFRGGLGAGAAGADRRGRVCALGWRAAGGWGTPAGWDDGAAWRAIHRLRRRAPQAAG